MKLASVRAEITALVDSGVNCPLGLAFQSDAAALAEALLHVRNSLRAPIALFDLRSVRQGDRYPESVS